MKNYVKDKIKKIEEEKKERSNIKDAKWIGEDSHILFKKLYDKSFHEQFSEILDYLNKNNIQKLTSYDRIFSSTQTGFNVYIYEDKERNSKIQQEISLTVFKMLSDFDLKRIKDEGTITVDYLDKNLDGSFNTEYDFYGDERKAKIKKEFNVNEKNKAFEYFIDTIIAST